MTLPKHYEPAPFECECCERRVVYLKMPGIGYYCAPCVKCFAADPPTTRDEPLPPGVHCYFTDDLTWMAASQLHNDWDRETFRERIQKEREEVKQQTETAPST